MNDNMVELQFGFENLDVWKKAIDFADQAISIAENLNSNRWYITKAPF